MKVLLNSSEMKSCDVSTMMLYGIPSAVLMERAALAVRDAAVEHFHPENVLVLCGSGNNGGDGFAAARLLMDQGIRADVLFLGTHARMTEQCQLEEDLPDDASLSGYDLIIDALFGIGLSREVLGRYADLINAVNRSDTPVLSVDMPSGVSADSGQVLGTAIRADLTVTFQFEKLGQKLFPGAERCGVLNDAESCSSAMSEFGMLFPATPAFQQPPAAAVRIRKSPRSIPWRKKIFPPFFPGGMPMTTRAIAENCSSSPETPAWPVRQSWLPNLHCEAALVWCACCLILTTGWRSRPLSRKRSLLRGQPISLRIRRAGNSLPAGSPGAIQLLPVRGWEQTPSVSSC